ncbi:MAG TPA: protein translocase subunit SecD [Bryobacteraceae bacterium]|nr:protein translocase subunit SecD [Bryobacteraceae bacterium]
MNRTIKIRAAIILAVILVCLYGIIGLPKSKAELMDNWKKNIHLGLDLSGGTQLVMQVQLQDAFKAVADNAINGMKQELQKDNVPVSGDITRNDPMTLEDADKIEIDVKGVPSDKSTAFRNIVNDQFSDWVPTAINATDYKLTMKPTAALKLKDDTMTQTMATIERKINALGLAESSVQKTGRSDAEAELLVQLPGVDDPSHVKQILQTQAQLEWDAVVDGPFMSREEALSKHGGILPLNTKLVPTPLRAGAQEWYLVSRTAIVRGTDIRDASATQGSSLNSNPNAWETNFVLTQRAAKTFAAYTESNIGNRAAIVVDGVVISAPTIQSKISDTGVITGASSQEEAADLALNLRAGSLPASVKYEEERTVGPSLGEDSIHEGFAAGIAGVIAVVFFMLFYYRRSGINATLALILNAVILIAALSYFDATLTLPGIAGIILTIGMAVDSNVLIFERIREELRTGKAVIAAVDAGFSKAFLTIIDTHVTTVVSCAFLFIFGTGPVKGFAVTLVIGLVANLFTAVFVSRTIFDWELSGKRQVAALSI